MDQPTAPASAAAAGAALGAIAITPSDGADLPAPVRAITINASGVLKYHDWNGNVWTTGTLPAGTYPLLARRVLATGTTATGLTGWV